GMMLVPLFLGALCHTFSPGAGKYFGAEFTIQVQQKKKYSSTRI
ncbi:2-keto-3-deoxygluconate permease, partial [Escherichia coli]|nr:2-keto-3-deoxygluconate permease [Escherichia coli]